MSRPRNQEGILTQVFDGSPGRKAEEYRSYIENLVAIDLARINGTTCVLTHKGYQVADGLWEIFVLQELEKLQGHRHEYVDLDKIAAAVDLTDGDAEAQELERLAARLASKSHLQAVDSDQGIVAVRITPNGKSMLRPYKATPLGPVS